MSSDTPEVSVSIILPTYNRAHFLRQAFDSIRSQTCVDWELIVVDDGSTDDTRRVVAAETQGWPQAVHYIPQPNQGAYGARNTGLDRAQGRYVAFFDSDDLWYSHHLKACVDLLDARPEVDWAYGACRVVEHQTGRTLDLNTFFVQGKPRPFLKLITQPAVNGFHLITDRNAQACMIEHGLYCGLQNSVIRRRVFDDLRFCTRFRNEAEDQTFVVRALARDTRLAYTEAVHVDYMVHAANSSAAAQGQQLERRIALMQEQARGYEEVAREVSFTPRERRALRRRLAREYFWSLGYALYWQNGRTEEALAMFRKGLALWPWNLALHKTFLLALTRCIFCRLGTVAHRITAKQVTTPEPARDPTS